MGLFGIWSVAALIALTAKSCSCQKFNPSNLTPVDWTYTFSANETDLIEMAGYDAQVYEILTEDGYYLQLFRIVKKGQAGMGHPILMLNGLSIRARSWILRGRGIDLPFILVEHGYDVWLGSQRGNPPIRRHVKYSVNDKRYWNFSFHESGLYDVPAMIDFILKDTNNTKLSYIGLSLGGTIFFSMMSERADYRDKIQSNVQFVPLVSAPNYAETEPIIKATYQLISFVVRILENSGLVEPKTDILLDLISWSMKAFCDNDSPVQRLCFDVMSKSIGGKFNSKSYDKAHFGYHIGASLGRTSIKSINHVMQLFRKGRFSKFDYGPIENMKVYGTDKPPNYDLGKINCPTAIFYGTNDSFLTVKSMKKTISLIGKSAVPYEVEDFNHIEFGVGRGSSKRAYELVVDFLDKNSGYNQ